MPPDVWLMPDVWLTNDMIMGSCNMIANEELLFSLRSPHELL